MIKKLVLTALILPAAAAACSSAWNLQPSGRMNYAELAESSGLVASRRFEDVYWTHNDSRHPADLFAVESSGQLIRSYRLEGAANRDWEDIAIDEENYLYLLDNTSRQDDQRRNFIYRIPEPDPRLDSTAPEVQLFTVAFPDGPYDCEALFLWKGVLYLVTKPWDGTLPRIYRYPNPGRDGVAAFVGYVPVYALITGADISPAGYGIALSSYTALLVYPDLTEPEGMARREPLISRLNARQVESVAWREDDIYIGNEQRELFKLSRSKWANSEAPFLQTPKKSVPRSYQTPSASLPLEDWKEGTWLELKAGSSGLRSARLTWSATGLHIGIDLPEGLDLGPADDPTRLQDWFRPGSVYVMLNPDGARPIVYGENDRCILIGRSNDGETVAQARFLRSGTLISAAEKKPSWIALDRSGNRLLISVLSSAPGMQRLEDEDEIGFNLIIITSRGDLLSWAPLTRPYSWDAPSIWGLLELDN